MKNAGILKAMKKMYRSSSAFSADDTDMTCDLNSFIFERGDPYK